MARWHGLGQVSPSGTELGDQAACNSLAIAVPLLNGLCKIAVEVTGIVETNTDKDSSKYLL